MSEALPSFTTGAPALSCASPAAADAALGTSTVGPTHHTTMGHGTFNVNNPQPADESRVMEPSQQADNLGRPMAPAGGGNVGADHVDGGQQAPTVGGTPPDRGESHAALATSNGDQLERGVQQQLVFARSVADESLRLKLAGAAQPASPTAVGYFRDRLLSETLETAGEGESGREPTIFDSIIVLLYIADGVHNVGSLANVLRRRAPSVDDAGALATTLLVRRQGGTGASSEGATPSQWGGTRPSIASGYEAWQPVAAAALVTPAPQQAPLGTPEVPLLAHTPPPPDRVSCAEVRGTSVSETQRGQPTRSRSASPVRSSRVMGSSGSLLSEAQVALLSREDRELRSLEEQLNPFDRSAFQRLLGHTFDDTTPFYWLLGLLGFCWCKWLDAITSLQVRRAGAPLSMCGCIRDIPLFHPKCYHWR